VLEVASQVVGQVQIILLECLNSICRAWVQVHAVTWHLDPCQGEVVLFNLGFVVSETDAIRAIDNADDHIVLSWDTPIHGTSFALKKSCDTLVSAQTISIEESFRLCVSALFFLNVGIWLTCLIVGQCKPTVQTLSPERLSW
jgi:hypothetical protein